MTRIVKLPKHNNVLIGRDLSNIFKNGHVYDVQEREGAFILVDLGETALSCNMEDTPNVNSGIDAIVCDSSVYHTIGESNHKDKDFALSSILPPEIERLIDEASALLDKGKPTKKQIAEMHKKLVNVLGPTDGFLFRWRSIVERI